MGIDSSNLTDSLSNHSSNSDSDSSDDLLSDKVKIIGAFNRLVRNFKHENVDFKCIECKQGKHNAANCDLFKKLNQRDRYSTVKTTGICYDCLDSKHPVKECTKDKDVVCGGEWKCEIST